MHPSSDTTSFATRAYRLLAIIATLLITVGCSSVSYEKEEYIHLKTKERVFTHHHENGLSLSTICKEGPGTATVSCKLTNNTALPLTLNDSVALYVEGRIIFKRKNTTKKHELQPGESITLPCDYTFYRSFSRKGDLIFPGQQRVFAKLDSYATPAVSLDLSTDNQFPFRFADHP